MAPRVQQIADPHDHPPSNDGGTRTPRRGYEQVADEIRQRIHSGLLPPGARLPREEALSAQLGVSRQTVREALRLLAAWNLVESTVGRRGGTFVVAPDTERLARAITDNLAFLMTNNLLTLEGLLEVRELLEVPAAALAAERADDEAIAQLRRWIVDLDADLPLEEQGRADVQFHVALLEAARNPLLMIADAPLLHLLTVNVNQIPQTDEFRHRMHDDHKAILEAVINRDGVRAQELLRDHLGYLRPCYAKVGWGGARISTSGANRLRRDRENRDSN
jgi:GntR family transcriptional regulator, transcriptional repressor for pyruvate dehydrogenase complex